MKARWVPEGQFIAAGKTLEYTCVGPSPNDASTLILLHEGLGCTRLWRDVPEALANATGYGVFAYSRAGYGQSDPTELPRPLDYMTVEGVDVLPEVLDAIGVRSAVLLGHSDGATIAAINAGQVADSRVTAIVLIAPHFFTEMAGLAEIANAREAFETGDLRQRLSKYHRDPDNAFRGWCDSWLHPEFKAWNVAAVLDQIKVPVLAIQGREDPYGSLAQIDAVTSRVTLAPVTTLILDECRHAPHLEHGPTVISSIAGFCDSFGKADCDSRTVSSLSADALPAYAYVPGENVRHPEGLFEAISQTVEQGQTADQLAESDAFRAGLRFLDAGFYWEAHEVLEPVWMVLPEGTIERRFVQGLIQLANGRLKLRMRRPKAALRLVGLARSLVPVESLMIMELDTQDVHRWIDALEGDVNLAL